MEKMNGTEVTRSKITSLITDDERSKTLRTAGMNTRPEGETKDHIQDVPTTSGYSTGEESVVNVMICEDGFAKRIPNKN